MQIPKLSKRELFFRSQKILGLIICYLPYLTSSKATALNYQILSLTGLMQQPTSQYYHLVYGGSLSLASSAEQAVLKTSYLERPEFHAYGYKDQEHAVFLELGSKILDHKFIKMISFLGVNRMRGSIRATSSNAFVSTDKKRSYSLDGIVYSVDVIYLLSPLTIQLSHKVLIGYTSQEDLESYVAWPHLFFTAGVGLNL